MPNLDHRSKWTITFKEYNLCTAFILKKIQHVLVLQLEEFRKKKAAAKKAASSNSVNGDLHEVKTSVADAINTFNKPSTNNNPEEDNNHSNLNHYSNIGALLGTYEDNRFKSESKKPYLKSIGSLNLGGGPELEKKLKYTEHVCSGVILGKELVNAPPNVLTPGSLSFLFSIVDRYIELKYSFSFFFFNNCNRGISRRS